MARLGFSVIWEAIASIFRPKTDASPPPIPAYLLQEVGAVATLWTHVETEWFHIFASLVRQLPERQAETVFRQFPTSSAQRTMVMAVADSTPNLPPKLRAELGSLNTDSNLIAGERNAIVHAQFEPESHGVFFWIARGDKTGRLNILAGRDGAREAGRVKKRIIRLHDRLMAFRAALEADPLKPPSKRRRG